MTVQGGPGVMLYAGAGVGVVVLLCLWLLIHRRGRTPGAPLHVREVVLLTCEEADSGTVRAVEFTARKRCASCGGTGLVSARRCRACRGRGLGGPTRQRATVRFPAGVRQGTTVRVPDCGVPGRYPGPSGDLLLTVRVVQPGGQPGRLRLARPVGTSPPVSRDGTHRGLPTYSQRSAATAAFLLTPVRRWRPRPSGGAGPAAVKQPGRAPGAGQAQPVPDPFTVTADGVRITVRRTGLLVEQERRSAGGARRWLTHLDMSWPDVAGLGFGTGRHDPVIGLYVTRSIGGQHHVVDSRSFTAAQWERLADGVAALSGGRVLIDVTRRGSAT